MDERREWTLVGGTDRSRPPRVDPGPGVGSATGVEQELFSRQMLAAMRFAPRANLVNAASLIVLNLYVAVPTHVVFAVVWLAFAVPAAAVGTLISWVGQRWVARRGQIQLSRWYYRLAVLEVSVQGVLNAILVGYLLPRVDPGRQVVLAATFAGILGAGAVALSMVRSIGALWVIVPVVGVVPTFLLMDQSSYDVLSAQLVLYGAVLVVGVVYLADSFRRGSLAAIRARQSRDVVELLLDDFEDGSRDWLWETDSQGLLTHVSERLAEVSGLSVHELRRLTLVDLLRTIADPSVDGQRSVDALTDALGRGQGIREHVLHVRVRGGQRWWSISGKPRTASGGTVVGWRGVGADITQAHNHAMAMVRLAQTDPLTGLANRRKFQERFEAVLDAAPGAGEVHLAIFDLDNFKAVNDTLGHSVGDELLVQVAARLVSRAEGAFIARLGGDEFAVVAQPTPSPDFPELVFAPYQEVFDEPFSVRGNRLTVTASVGCARARPGSTGAEELVGRADLALYAAKAAGVGRMSSFSPPMSLRAHQRAALVADLELAIEREEFLFHYQPQHELVTGKVVATEALLRWQHPTRGLLSPVEFLDVAEESGLLVPIGAIMLRHGCRKLAGMGGCVRLALNVSQVELHGQGFLDQLEAAMEEFGVDPRRIELEVTETAAATPQSEAILREARQLGVRVAIDDFGVGYSSLARLQRLPVDLLKVDRVFAAALSSAAPRARDVAVAIMKSAVDIASALGIQALAEGIEDSAQLAQVRRLGFDLAQGYFVATPAPDVTRRLRLVDPPTGTD